MRKLTIGILAILLIANVAIAQRNFEGEIVYGIKVLGENADQMAAFMPTSYSYQISGSNFLFKMNGGMTAAMIGEIMINGATGKSYMLKHDEKTAYEMGDEEDGAANPVKPTVKALEETIKIAGYDCKKYEVTMHDEATNTEVKQYFWCSKDIRLKRPKDGKIAAGGDIFMDGIEGMPLKIMTENMGMTMIMTATKVEEKKIPASTFAIPKGYEVKKFDAASLFGGMGE